MVDVVLQHNMFGPPQPADVVEGVKAILRDFPSARDDYKELVMRYWLRYCGLAELLETNPGPHELIAWIKLPTTVSAKTIQNRGMEEQLKNHHLAPSEAARALRDARANQGPVR